MLACNAQVVNEVACEFPEEYGKDAPVTVSCGKKHGYQGMVIDYSGCGAVFIAMFDIISDLLKKLPLNKACLKLLLHCT